MQTPEMKQLVTNSLRYWERLRLVYNAVLVAVVMMMLWLAPAADTPLQILPLVRQLFLLAVVANVFYCAAYPADLLAQFSDLRQTWLRFRWILFVIGTSFAALIAQAISAGIVSNH